MTRPNTYAIPIFPVGTGLGNRLFHWCDAKVYSYKTGSKFISPRWCRFSFGKHLRQWRKARFLPEPLFEYFHTFDSLPGDYSWRRYIFNHSLLPQIRISQYPEILDLPLPPKNRLVCFDKSHYVFNGYEPFQQRLTKDLLASVKPHLLKKAFDIEKPFIGIHVRLGDGFKPPEPGFDGFVRTGWLQQTPIQWFKESLKLTREVARMNVPAYIFSDGSACQLAPLLEEDNTFLYKSNNPIVDLLALSRSWLILGSGSSSFSAFAAYLGLAHAITAPGHPFSSRGLVSNKFQVVDSINPRESTASTLLQGLMPPSQPL
ncbi:hypothetical protein OAZ06_04055 [Synechococcus sp. AH-736-G20]|nr:hypothetical protein [Synechococcus sp. AH-736-G20]